MKTFVLSLIQKESKAAASTLQLFIYSNKLERLSLLITSTLVYFWVKEGANPLNGVP
jgi:hypothetical protein